MEIKLKRSGGITGIPREAVKEVAWSDEELHDLIAIIKRKEESPIRGRDTTGYLLEVKNETIPIDLDKIPSKYKAIFDSLKDNLKPVKF